MNILKIQIRLNKRKIVLFCRQQIFNIYKFEFKIQKVNGRSVV